MTVIGIILMIILIFIWIEIHILNRNFAKFANENMNTFIDEWNKRTK